MSTVITYAEIKAAMQAAGLPVSSGSQWLASDQGIYDEQYIPNISYAAGVNPDPVNGNYGVAYPAVMPTAIADAVAGGAYSATLAGSPLTGAHASTPVTWTLTETNGPATSYAWTLGDGNTQTTTVPNVTHTYAAAGTYTASVVVTIDGVVKPSIVAAAPAVLT
jgi:PKD repeat protein